MGNSQMVKKFALLLIAIILLIILPNLFDDVFIKHLMIIILLWSTMGVAWNMLAGLAGQVSLGHAVFYGIGAYTTAIISSKYGLSPWISVIVAVVLAMAIAFVLGQLLFRLSGFYFSIATIVISEIALVCISLWRWVGDTRGIFIKYLGNSFFNMQFKNKEPYYYLALGLLAICMLAAYWLSHSKAGYYFRAIRDEAEGAISLGIDITRYKTIAYMFSAAFTAVAGIVYANYVLYIDPNSVMNLQLSTLICLVTVLGGIGTLWGPVVGSVVLISISEFSRLYLSGSGKAVDLIVYGVFIVVFAVYQPTGILGLLKSVLKRKRPPQALGVAERSE